MSKAAAAILTYNQQHLASAMREQLGPDMILIDNGSQPEIHLPGVMTFRFSENRYFTGGWNTAMKIFYIMGYQWVWMLNDDVIGVSAQMLDDLHDLALLLGPDCAAISPTYNSPHSQMHSQGLSPYRQVNWLDWTGPLVSIDWWNKVGGFDERFTGYGCDISWCRRAADLGAKFYVTDQHQFHHIGSVTALTEGISAHIDAGRMDQIIQEIHGVDSWMHLF